MITLDNQLFVTESQVAELLETSESNINYTNSLSIVVREDETDCNQSSYFIPVATANGNYEVEIVLPMDVESVVVSDNRFSDEQHFAITVENDKVVRVVKAKNKKHAQLIECVPASFEDAYHPVQTHAFNDEKSGLTIGFDLTDSSEYLYVEIGLEDNQDRYSVIESVDYLSDFDNIVKNLKEVIDSVVSNHEKMEENGLKVDFNLDTVLGIVVEDYYQPTGRWESIVRDIGIKNGELQSFFDDLFKLVKEPNTRQ